MASEPSNPPVMTRRVRYGNRLEAFLAEPARAGQHPTMILLHERYGLAQHTLDLTEKFAREGYLCLVKRAADAAVADRFLLRRDAERLLAEASASTALTPEAESSAEARAIGARLCGGAATAGAGGRR